MRTFVVILLAIFAAACSRAEVRQAKAETHAAVTSVVVQTKRATADIRSDPQVRKTVADIKVGARKAGAEIRVGARKAGAEIKVSARKAGVELKKDTRDAKADLDRSTDREPEKHEKR